MLAPAEMRGKLSGLFTMSESLGRVLGPAGFANMFAWSISSSSPAWVDYHFVFFASSIIMVLVSFLAWKTVTDENMSNENLSSGVNGPVAVGPTTRKQ